MEFTIVCSKVNPVFSQCIKTCDTKASTTDGDFLFHENDGNLWITSINRNIEQTVFVPTSNFVADKGESFFVNGQSVCELFKQFPDDEAVCTYNGSVFVVKGNVRDVMVELPTTISDNFAAFNFVSDCLPIECDAQKFKESLKLTSFSASVKSDADSLIAVHVVLSGDKVIAESSDSERISVSEIDMDMNDADMSDVSFLLPKETSDVLMSILDKVDVIKIEKGKRLIRFYWGETTFTSRLICDIEEEYPDLQEYMNGSVIAEIQISRQELLNSLKLIGLLVKESAVALKCSKDGLRISANEKDRGSGTNLIEPQSVSGSAETTIIYKYLMAAVTAMNSAWINLAFVELASDPNIHICLKEDSYKHFIFAAGPNASHE